MARSFHYLCVENNWARISRSHAREVIHTRNVTSARTEWRPRSTGVPPDERACARLADLLVTVGWSQGLRVEARLPSDLRLPGGAPKWPTPRDTFESVISANGPEPPVSNQVARRVLLAKPRGYCAGVDRAVQSVEIALERYGAPVYVRKEIVHNKHVVRGLEERGAVFVEEAEEVPEGAVVVFSAHGIAPEVREDAKRRSLRTIDATCPLVTKVHNEARRFAAQDYDILLIGHEGHEEVVGTTGEAPSRIHLVDGPDGGTDVQVRDPARVAWLSQTTLSVDETTQTVAALRERFPLLADPPSDDICYATQNRQVAVKQIASQSDLVLVVGSRNSSNSVRLVEVALDAGAPAAYLVEDAMAVEDQWLDGVATVGVTSGASVPEELVSGVLDRLADCGFGSVEEVEAVEEHLQFALPPELRRAAPREG